MQGIILIEVDDLYEGGTERHRGLMDRLKQRFRFGKHSSLMTREGGTFDGMRMIQNKDFSFQYSMKDYILSRLKEIPISKERKKELDKPITEAEFSQLRALTGSALRAARKCRPDVAGPVSILQLKGKDGTVKELIEANAVVQHLKETADLGMHIRPMDPTQVRVCVHSDASLNTVPTCKSQGATLVTLVDQDVVEGREGLCNFVAWRSGTIDLVCAGSLAAEANAMAAACHQAEWTQHAFCELTNALYDPLIRRRVLHEWEQSCPDKPFRLHVREALVVKNDTDKKLRKNICLTDARSLYDALERDSLNSKEKQVALVTAEIKQVMSVAGLIPRWMPHNHMAVDGLTKEMKKSNLKPLLSLMKTGRLRLTAEDQEAELRKELKEQGIRVQREKGK
jgi:hypothetical protein